MTIISFGSNINVSRVLVVTSSVTLFLINLSFSITVLHSFLSSILTIAKPEISSTKGASIFINLCSFGLSTICYLKGMALPCLEN